MPRRLIIVVLALLCVLAGCGDTTVPAESSPATPSPSPPPDATVEVSVTTVVDGDTIRIEYDNGIEDTVRLVGVDTPEVHTTNEPSEFEGVPETEAGRNCLRSAGVDASNAAKDALLGETVGLAFDPNTDRRGRYGRLLAYIVDDGEVFNYRLVATGDARVYDESAFSRADEFLDAERAAREQRRGLWQCSDPESATQFPTETTTVSGLTFVEINADAAGNDNENLNDEYVVFSNRGDTSLALAGWTVTDAAGREYTFENATLEPGTRLTLYTGTGTDSRTERYWGSGSPIWNNGGDTVTVRSPAGSVVLERSY